MPKHAARLILLLAAFGVVAYAAKAFFTTDSFYLYGHYRGDSVAEIASGKPKYKGQAFCEPCHAERYAEWSKGVHNSTAINKVVKCEVCHGAAGSRDVRGMFEYSATGPDHPNGLKLIVPTDTRRLCALCHEKMPARPVEQRQIVVADHAGTQQCTACHNPHSPRVMIGAAAATSHAGNAAAGKTKSATCAGCHGISGVSGSLPGPNLAGQKEAYLVDAIKAYRAGSRDNPAMVAMTGGLSDADIENLAAYFSGSQCKSALNADKQLAVAGQAEAPKCAACHGANGISTNPLWPNLAGQSRDYLVTALRAYKSGGRRNIIMAGISKGLNDIDVENLAAYFANAGCK